MHSLAIPESPRTYPIFRIKSYDNRERPTESLYGIINLIKENVLQKKPFYSFELTPTNIDLDLNRFQKLSFSSITWRGSQNLTGDCIEQDWFRFYTELNKSMDILLHLSCDNMDEMKLREILSHGVLNVLALKGDTSSENQTFHYSNELVEAIKSINPNISIAAGSYPEKHPESISMDSELKLLKRKISLGVDFLITQTCFRASSILEFIRTCRSIGISIPIVPGIFVPETYNSLIRMCKVCQVRVPDDDFKIYKSIQGDLEKFQSFSIERAVKLIQELIGSELVYGVHFFTLNRFNIIEIVINKFDFWK